jgi:hypothetical protein
VSHRRHASVCPLIGALIVWRPGMGRASVEVLTDVVDLQIGRLRGVERTTTASAVKSDPVSVSSFAPDPAKVDAVTAAKVSGSSGAGADGQPVDRRSSSRRGRTWGRPREKVAEAV